MSTQKTFDVYRTNCTADVLSTFIGQVDACNIDQALRIATLLFRPYLFTELWVNESDIRVARYGKRSHPVMSLPGKWSFPI